MSANIRGVLTALCVVYFVLCVAHRSAAQRKETSFEGQCVGVDGSPVDSAVVHILAHGYGFVNHISSVKAGDDGRFQASVLPTQTNAKSFSLVVAANGYASRFVPANVKENNGKNTVKLHRAAKITGTVRDANGNPVRGAIVHVGRCRQTGVHAAVTNDVGEFTIDDVRAVKSFKPNEPSANRVFASHPQLGFAVSKIDRIPSETEIAFQQPLPESFGTDYQRIATGVHKFPGGVTVTVTRRVYHGSDVMTEGVIRWPESEFTPAMTHKFSIAADAFGNREKWTLFSPMDRCQIWVASGMGKSPYTRVIDFSDPTSIAGLALSRKTGDQEPANQISAENAVADTRVENVVGKEDKETIPSEAMRLISSAFPIIAKDDARYKLVCDDDVSEAKIVTKFSVSGKVTNANGDPLSRIVVRAFFHGERIGGWMGEITRTGTKKDGTYTIEFSVSIGALSQNSNIIVAPLLANHFESSLGDSGRFSATLLPTGEPTQLLPGKTSTADFQFLPAATLVGSIPAFADGKVSVSWQSPNGIAESVERPIDQRGEFRLADLPATESSEVKVEVFGPDNQLAATGTVKLEPQEMNLSVAADKSLLVTAVDSGAVRVRIVRTQKPMAAPSHPEKFAALTQRWLESCQSNNTKAIADFNPNVWQEVVTGYNVVHVKFTKPRKMSVHTDDGQQMRMIREVAFPMYDVKPGSVFALSGKETLVLQDPLIEPTISIMKHPALDCFVTKWYRSYIDAWNHQPLTDSDHVAKLTVDPAGKLTLDKNPLPDEIRQLGGILQAEGYDRRKSIALVEATPNTPFSKLHWVMWYLGQHGWKGKVVLRVSGK